MLASDVGPGKEVGLVRAQGLPQETVLYGVGEVGDEWEGAFEIGVSSGQITVGTRGPDLLVIVRINNQNDYSSIYFFLHSPPQNGAPLSVTFTVFAYYESAGVHGNRVR